MDYSEYIGERFINQGNLAFIIHNQKPVKSGWWRKVRNSKAEVIYILEKPFHKDFSLEHIDIKESRIEHGACVMKTNTLSYGQNVENKFNVLASASGLAQYIIMKNNYLQNVELSVWNELMKESITITNDFEKLFKMHFNKKQLSSIEEFAQNMI
jgi:hypothetical protein